MPSPLARLKPGVSARTQLALAAGLWSAVGAALLASGARWVVGGAGPAAGALLAAAAAAGLLKGRFVLDRAARRISDRIAERGDGTCAGGFLSVRSWLLVVAMSLAGRFLRGGAVPAVALGTLYAAVGVGLLFSSRIAWGRLLDGGAPGAPPPA